MPLTITVSIKDQQPAESAALWRASRIGTPQAIAVR